MRDIMTFLPVAFAIPIEFFELKFELARHVCKPLKNLDRSFGDLNSNTVARNGGNVVYLVV